MNLYEVLQVDKKASKEIILMAYRALAKQYHPDVNPENHDMMKKINYAKEILIDDDLRKVYDDQLQGGYEFYESANMQQEKSVSNPKSYTDNLSHDMSNSNPIVKTAGPWKRYFAKMVDFLVLGALVGYGLGRFFPTVFVMISSIQLSLISELILTLFVVIFEGILISIFKTTPGKWILSLQVLDESQHRLSVFRSIYRSFHHL